MLVLSISRECDIITLKPRANNFFYQGGREGRRDWGAAGPERGRQAGVGEEQAGGVQGQHGARAGVLQEDEHLPGLPRDGEQEDLATRRDLSQVYPITLK